MAAHEAVALSYLSPYKPGSPSSTTKGLDSSPTYNEDRTWFNIHVTRYIKFTNTVHLSEYELKLLQTTFNRLKSLGYSAPSIASNLDLPKNVLLLH